MKKYLLMLCVLLAILYLNGCGKVDYPLATECDHDYSSVVTKEATYDAEGEMTYTCCICFNRYTEVIEKLEKHVVPTPILDMAVTNAKYYASPFSITVGEIVLSAVDNYTLMHYTGEEAIAMGYLSMDQIDSSVDINRIYCSIISGDTMVNPDIPYLTDFEEEAVKVWMIFDVEDNLLNSGVQLCENLRTYAILTMASDY